MAWWLRVDVLKSGDEEVGDTAFSTNNNSLYGNEAKL
jgi:hypothetical protein